MRMKTKMLLSAITLATMAITAQASTVKQETLLIKQLENVIQQEKEYTKYQKLPKVNLNAVNQPLGIVMQNFAVLTNYSLSFADGVDLNTPITIRIVNTPIKKALESILYPIGYSFDLDTKYKRITVKAFVEKNIQIPPILLDSEDMKYTFSSTGKTGDDSGSGGGGSNGSNSSSGGEVSASSKVDVTNNMKGSDAVKILLKHINAILSDKGTASLDPVTGSLYIRDYRPYVEKAEEYVKQWVNQFSKQVYIRAYIVDIMLDKNHELGIDWSTVQRSLIRHTTTLQFTQTAASTITNPVATLTANNGSGANPFNLLLKALSTQGKVRVLSEPKIVIMNHELGYIQSGDSIPYVSNIEENFIGTEGNNAQTTYQISRVLEGVTLAIKPHILKNNMIDLTIVPTLSSIKDWRKLNIGNNMVDNPVITTRNTYTKLVVKNGEMIVIGGAQTNINKVEKMRVPLLGDIPILGTLFGYTQHKKSKSVMLVILQAQIVDALTAYNLKNEAKKVLNDAGD